MNYFNPEDTICAITTGGGMSAIAIIRVSGIKSIEITNSVFSKEISESKTHTLHFGNFIHDKEIVDEIIVSIFRGSKSFTGEESVEISCHGSVYIQNKIIQIKEKLNENKPTIPSILKDEKECNIFLRAKNVESFSKLRDLKDNF